jgi:enterochelin esterase-like enzyme
MRSHISDVASFSVEDIADKDTHKKIRLYYDDPEKQNMHVLLVVFPGIEYQMDYDETKKRWFVEIEKPNTTRDYFEIYATSAEYDIKEKMQAPLLQQGYLALTDGKPHPWIYGDSNTPKGSLQKLLYKIDGSLADPIPEVELKEGERLITVYFPPDYKPDLSRKTPYNLQITLDGMQFLEVMHMNTAFDNLIAAQKIEPTVVVFISPYCGKPIAGKKGFGSVCPPGYSMDQRLQEYTCNPEFADKLEKLTDTLRMKFPDVITTDSERTTIWGFSAGALQAAYTALLHPDKFGNVVAQSMMAFNIPERNLLLLPEGRDASKIPIDEIPKGSVLLKLVEGQLTAYQVINGEIELVKKIELDQLQTSEISSRFPRYGKNKIITPTNDRDLFDKVASIIGEDLIEQAGNNWRVHITDDWRTGTARLHPTEQHNEYLSQVVAVGFDPISNRSISPSLPLKFYFTAGIDEEKYEPAEGTANLVVATDKFASLLREKRHTVVEHQTGQEARLVRVISPGGHTPITQMESAPDALRIMGPRVSLQSDFLMEKISSSSGLRNNAPVSSTALLMDKGIAKKSLSHTVQESKSVRTMTVAEEFIKKLQDATGNQSLPKKFWDYSVSSSSIPTFQDVLDKYAEYYKSLSSSQKEILSKIFWEQVKETGTPIIEENSRLNSECNVYFLMPKDKILDSTEKLETKQDLYLQGDFHGYGSIGGKQKLEELSETGIMLHKDQMPRDALVVYSYIQVEPSHHSIKPEPERSPFFEKSNEFIPHYTHTNFPTITKSDCKDENSNHSHPYGFVTNERVFRISVDSKRAEVQTKPVDWLSLLSVEKPSDARNFIFHARLYSDKKGDLQPAPAKAEVTQKYHDDLNNSDQAGSPYANFTRSIHVFKPASDKIEDIIVINDGMPYLITGTMDHFEKMVEEGKISRNTALVFVNTLPGLKSTLSPEAAEVFNKDPSANVPGMGVRLIDYKHGIDQYTDFIATKLFPQLKDVISVPDDPNHKIMIGSSLSGTASIYIGSTRPDLFGAVIAQSPSPDNREILSKIPRAMPIERNIHLSCGEFEHPNYAAASANIEYATELSSKLGIPLQTGAHGHQFVAWNDKLEQAVPAILKAGHTSREDVAHNENIAAKYASPTPYSHRLTRGQQ